MQRIKIHKIQSESGSGNAFKICTAEFDGPSEVQESIQTNSYNIVWIQKGNGRYSIDFEIYDIKEGMIFFLTPGQMYKVESEGVVEGVRMSFEQDFYCVDTFTSQASCSGILFKNPYQKPFISLNKKQISELQFIIEQINAEFGDPGLAHTEIVHTYLQLFLIKAMRVKKEQIDELSLCADEETSFLYQFQNNLEAYFKSNHSVSYYADLLNVSPKSLHKKVKEITGKPVSLMIQNRIILEAKRLLYHTDKSVKEIGYELGFDDPSYFSRFFAKQVNEAPTEFQQRIKEGNHR